MEKGNDIRSEYLTSGMKMVVGLALELLKKTITSNTESSKKELEKAEAELKHELVQLITAEYNNLVHNKAFKQVQSMAATDPDLDVYQAMTRLKQEMGTMSEEKIEIHPAMRAFNSSIREHKIKLKIIDSEENGDDEVIMTAKDSFVDPVTKRPIKNPVRNTLCNHLYDRESITRLTQMNPKTKCPIAGCSNKQSVSVDQLETDFETMTKLKFSQETQLKKSKDKK